MYVRQSVELSKRLNIIIQIYNEDIFIIFFFVF